jgi:hypothetical protein
MSKMHLSIETLTGRDDGLAKQWSSSSQVPGTICGRFLVPVLILPISYFEILGKEQDHNQCNRSRNGGTYYLKVSRQRVFTS